HPGILRRRAAGNRPAGIESIDTTIQVVGTEVGLAVSAPPKLKKSTSKAVTKPATPRSTRAPRAVKQADKKTKVPAKTAAKTATPTTKTTTAPVAKKSRKSTKDDGGWQSFMVEEFKGKPLTEVVEVVFTRSPDALMGSTELIGQIFSADIPKKERTAARDRLLNILSIGVNEKKWYRAKPGQYTLTKVGTAKSK
ncbi:MAG: hypothetical protein IGR76_08300, partial [Synechococcales cyanobacterium T60_A2020_003]|nr:hypothetical protein [Synechococcales cyanobacterium T60_A2020_003]